MNLWTSTSANLDRELILNFGANTANHLRALKLSLLGKKIKMAISDMTGPGEEKEGSLPQKERRQCKNRTREEIDREKEKAKKRMKINRANKTPEEIFWDREKARKGMASRRAKMKPVTHIVKNH